MQGSIQAQNVGSPRGPSGAEQGHLWALHSSATTQALGRPGQAGPSLHRPLTAPHAGEAFRWGLTHTCAATGRPSCEPCGQCKQTGPGPLTVEPPWGPCVPGLEVPPEAAHRPHLCSKASGSQEGVRGSATAPPETPTSSSRPSALGGLGCRPEFVTKPRLPSSQSPSSLSVESLRLFLESLVLCPPASPEDTTAPRPPPPAQAPPAATSSRPQEPSPQAPVGVDDGAQPSWPGGPLWGRAAPRPVPDPPSPDLCSTPGPSAAPRRGLASCFQTPTLRAAQLPVRFL